MPLSKKIIPTLRRASEDLTLAEMRALIREKGQEKEKLAEAEAAKKKKK